MNWLIGLNLNYTLHDLSLAGLDPALPFFATNSLSNKLDATDAHFVDVIHTNIGYFGKIEASGHFDFYMNGGQTQPACYNHKSKYPPHAKYFSLFAFAKSASIQAIFVV